MSRANPVRPHKVEFDCIHKKAGKVISCCGPLRMLQTNLDQFCQKNAKSLKRVGFWKDAYVDWRYSSEGKNQEDAAFKISAAE